jgi:hypothetical protein
MLRMGSFDILIDEMVSHGVIGLQHYHPIQINIPLANKYLLLIGDKFKVLELFPLDYTDDLIVADALACQVCQVLLDIVGYKGYLKPPLKTLPLSRVSKVVISLMKQHYKHPGHIFGDLDIQCFLL